MEFVFKGSTFTHTSQVGTPESWWPGAPPAYESAMKFKTEGNSHTVIYKSRDYRDQNVIKWDMESPWVKWFQQTTERGAGVGKSSCEIYIDPVATVESVSGNVVEAFVLSGKYRYTNEERMRTLELRMQRR